MSVTSEEKREQIIEAKLRGEDTATIMLWVKTHCQQFKGKSR